jgi:glutamyl-tRNA synthetase
VPTGRRVEFDDMVHGAQSFATDDIGDFILRRADGSAAFFFSNAIDDAEMGITHVLRGEDHLTNTPRQLLVLEALGLRAPTYGHLSLLVGADDSPHRSATVPPACASSGGGLSPAALANHLFRLGHSSSENGADTRTDHAFCQPSGVRRRAEESQLDAWQRDVAHHLPLEESERWLESETPRGIDAAPPGVHRRDPSERAAAGDVALARRGFGRPLLDELRWRACAAGPQFFRAAADAAAANGANLDAIVDAVKAATGAKGQALWKPLASRSRGGAHTDVDGRMLRAMPDSAIHDRLNRFAA